MNYATHNFVSNYLSAIGSDDPILSEDLLISEIAKSISRKPNSVIIAIKKSGFDISEKSDSDKIINTLTDKLPDSEELQKNIAILLLGGNHNASGDSTNPTTGDGLTGEDTKLAQTAGKAYNLGKQLFEKDKSGKSILENLGDGLSNLFKGKKKKKAEQERIEEENKKKGTPTGKDNTQSLKNKVNNTVIKKSNTSNIIIVAIGIAALAGLGFFIIRKFVKKGSAGSPVPENINTDVSTNT